MSYIGELLKSSKWSISSPNLFPGIYRNSPKLCDTFINYRNCGYM